MDKRLFGSLRRTLLSGPLVLSLLMLPTSAQSQGRYSGDGQYGGQGQYSGQYGGQYGRYGNSPYENGYNRGRSRRDVPQNYYGGMRDGGRSGNYDRNPNERFRDRREGYDRYHEEGGIGPGKGALIGGAGGAVLGALFGGGMKGAVIGGAAGAGIGAVAGQANQNHREREEY